MLVGRAKSMFVRYHSKRLMSLVVRTEITYMDTEDEYKYMVSKIHIFKVHIFKLHVLFLKIAKIHIFKSIKVSDCFLGLA